MRTPPAARGLTLIEIAIAVAIVAFTLTTAAPSFSAFLEIRRIDGVASQLALDLRDAREAAIRRQGAVRFTVQQAPWGSCYVVHTGDASQCRCDPAGVPVCRDGAHALKAVPLAAGGRIAVQSNVASILFDPRHGTATPAATLKVTGASGRAVHQVVNVMGRVRSCTSQVAAPAVPGYRPC
ncbi:MAG TPA: GspH/FimT family pseudopilin [Albitalea sp.]